MLGTVFFFSLLSFRFLCFCIAKRIGFGFMNACELRTVVGDVSVQQNNLPVSPSRPVWENPEEKERELTMEKIMRNETSSIPSELSSGVRFPFCVRLEHWQRQTFCHRVANAVNIQWIRKRSRKINKLEEIPYSEFRKNDYGLTGRQKLSDSKESEEEENFHRKSSFRSSFLLDGETNDFVSDTRIVARIVQIPIRPFATSSSSCTDNLPRQRNEWKKQQIKCDKNCRKF